MKEIKFIWEPKYQTKNAVELLNALGETVRPDKLLIDGDKAVVIDFKTVENEKSHVSQMLKYKRVLDELGFIKVEAFILYTDTGKLSPILMDLA